MDERRSHRSRIEEIKAHAMAFAMLVIALVALYTHVLYLAMIPLLWMAYRAGREQGRDQAQREVEDAHELLTSLQLQDADKRASERRAKVLSNTGRKR
jgi:hypothetical protein